jgi:hypothetical protein
MRVVMSKRILKETMVILTLMGVEVALVMRLYKTVHKLDMTMKENLLSYQEVSS